MLGDDRKEQEQRNHDQEEAVARELASGRRLAGDRDHATLLSVGDEALVSETAASSASRSASEPNSPMTRPRWMIRYRSQTRISSSSSDEAIRTAAPEAASWTVSPRISLLAPTSRPRVGSSRKKIGGEV